MMPVRSLEHTRRIVAVAVLVATVCSLSQRASAKATSTEPTCDVEPISISVAAQSGTRGLTTGYPLALAGATGIAEEEGITLDIIDVGGGAIATTALISGEVDVALMASDGLRTTAEGADVISIGPILDVSPHFLVANPDVIQDWPDLAGTTGGVSSLEGTLIESTRQLLEGAGLDPDSDVEFVLAGNGSARLAALQAGQIDFGLLSPPTAFAAEDLGLLSLGDRPPGGDVVRMHAATIAVRKSGLESEPTVAERFMRMWLRTAAWMKDPANGDALLDLSISILEEDEAVVQASLDHYLRDPQVAPYYLAEDGEIDEAAIEALVSSFVADGVVEPDFDPSTLWTDEASTAASSCLP